MTFSARLEDLELSSLLNLIALNRTSGRLRLVSRDAHALLVFRKGRLIYASPTSLRETFGSILVRQGLIPEAVVKEALERQHSQRDYQRLGEILVESGHITTEDLTRALARQTVSVIEELLGWTSGFFKMDEVEVAPEDVEVDVEELLIPEGFDTTELLQTALGHRKQGRGQAPAPRPTRRKSRAAAAPAPAPAPAAPPGRPPIAGDAALALMRYAAQVVSRGVLFQVHPERIAGIGQFGIDANGQVASERVRRLSIPVDAPSALGGVVRRRQTYRGPLGDGRWNDALAECLGGGRPDEIVIIPMVVDDAVTHLFYGDNQPDGTPIGPIEGVEFLMSETADRIARGRR